MPKRKSASGDRGPTTVVSKKPCSAPQHSSQGDFIAKLGRDRDEARVHASKFVPTSIQNEGVADRLISWSKKSHKKYAFVQCICTEVECCAVM